MSVRCCHMPFHRAVGKAIKCINDRNDRYWFYYCYFMQTEYLSPRLDFYDKIFKVIIQSCYLSKKLYLFLAVGEIPEKKFLASFYF